MSEDLAVLASRAEELGGKVDKLTLAYEQQGRRLGRAERATSRVAAGAVVLLVLVGVMGWLIWQQADTSERLESVTQRSLCPVFGLVIGGFDPTSRAAGKARDDYIATLAVMRNAYGELHCTAPLVAPRTGS